jgi:hypothetical protein
MAGPPTVVCCICNEQVTKRQTYSIGSGRACKKHEGVQEKATLAQAGIEKAKLEKIQAAQRKQEAQRRAWEKESPGDFLKPKCFGCKAVGMHARDWFMRIMVLNAKHEITFGKALNIFDISECQKAYQELAGLTPLFIRDFVPGTRLKGLSREGHNMAGLFQFVALCNKCCALNDIDPFDYMREVTLEDLLQFGAISQVYVQPAIQAAARKEIEAAN